MRKYGDEIVALESCLIQTLGFNVCINHAHTIIIKTCQMIKGDYPTLYISLYFGSMVFNVIRN